MWQIAAPAATKAVEGLAAAARAEGHIKVSAALASIGASLKALLLAAKAEACALDHDPEWLAREAASEQVLHSKYTQDG